MRHALVALVALVAAPVARAQAPDYFAPRPFALDWSADLELRQEWTEPFGLRSAESRQRARLLAGGDGEYRCCASVSPGTSCTAATTTWPLWASPATSASATTSARATRGWTRPT